MLRLLGRDADAAKSKEHVLLSVLAERRLAAGQNADLAGLMEDREDPPIDSIGALSVDSFLKTGCSKLMPALPRRPISTVWCSGLRRGGSSCATRSLHQHPC